MKTIRTYCTKWYVLIPLIITFFVEGCTKNAEISNLKIESNSKFSGEDIFRAVFFGKGVAVAKISSLTSQIEDMALNESDKKGIAMVEESIIDVINKTEPSFMIDFGKKMKSGNVDVINTQLRQASIMISKSLNFDLDYLNSEKGKNQLNLLRNELTKDAGKTHTLSEKSALLNSNKYQSLIKGLVNPKSDQNFGTSKTTLDEEHEAEGKKPIYDTLVAIYKYFVLAGAGVVLIAIWIGEAPSSEFLTLSDKSDPLFREQVVATIAKEFHEAN